MTNFPAGDAGFCSLVDCYASGEHGHGGETVFEGHVRYADLFTRYSRTITETRDIVTVDEGNIGLLAAMIGGAVDYTRGNPELVDASRNWRIQIGWQLSLQNGQLVNQNGFNNDNTWVVGDEPFDEFAGFPVSLEEIEQRGYLRKHGDVIPDWLKDLLK
jgi:hypothetical protein